LRKRLEPTSSPSARRRTAINHRKPGSATETTVLGPFYVAGAKDMPMWADIAGDAPGEPATETVSSDDSLRIALERHREAPLKLSRRHHRLTLDRRSAT